MMSKTQLLEELAGCDARIARSIEYWSNPPDEFVALTFWQRGKPWRDEPVGVEADIADVRNHLLEYVEVRPANQKYIDEALQRWAETEQWWKREGHCPASEKVEACKQAYKAEYLSTRKFFIEVFVVFADEDPSKVLEEWGADEKGVAETMHQLVQGRQEYEAEAEYVWEPASGQIFKVTEYEYAWDDEEWEPVTLASHQVMLWRHDVATGTFEDLKNEPFPPRPAR